MEYSRSLLETRVSEEVPTTTFQQDYDSAWKRISAIPNPLGAAARLLLVAIGLSWLIIGPLFGGNFVSPFTDPVLQSVALGAVALLAFCVVGAAIHYYWECLLAEHEIDQTEVNIELRHLGGAGGLAAEKIRADGAALVKRLDDLLKRVVQLANGLAEPLAVPAPASKIAAASFITDSGVDVLVHPQLEALATEAYTRFQADLSKHNQKDGVAPLESALWHELILKHAAAVCREYICRLTFDQCVEAMGPFDWQRQALVNKLVYEARQPALGDVPVDPAAPTFCFAAPEQWKQFCGPHDTLQFYNLNLRDMLMVSVVPIRKFALS